MGRGGHLNMIERGRFVFWLLSFWCRNSRRERHESNKTLVQADVGDDDDVTTNRLGSIQCQLFDALPPAVFLGRLFVLVSFIISVSLCCRHHRRRVPFDILSVPINGGGCCPALLLPSYDPTVVFKRSSFFLCLYLSSSFLVVVVIVVVSLSQADRNQVITSY